MMKTVDLLRQSIAGDTFTDAEVKAVLPDSDARSGQMKRCFKRQEVLRIRRGLYCFGLDYSSKPIEKYALANAICAPSYISFGSALFLHGLVSADESPVLQSVTGQRSASYDTPLGRFTFQGRAYYTDAGVIQKDGVSIATPERALVDCLRASEFFCILIMLDGLKFRSGFRADLAVFDSIASVESPSRKAARYLYKFFDKTEHDWDALHPDKWRQRGAAKTLPPA